MLRKLLFCLAIAVLFCQSGFTRDGGYSVALDPDSPWPKFRRNALQNGRSSIVPGKADEQRVPWVYKTGKGIFSSPVVDGDENIYIGSADNYFYSLDSMGNLNWKYLTGEIIDSSALLDDRGNVLFGSGDGFLYALDKVTGDVSWRYEAHTPAQVEEMGYGSFQTINWFEANLAVGTDGTIFIANDNRLLYSIDPDTQKENWVFYFPEFSWTCPAYNPLTNRLYAGSLYFVRTTSFCIDAATGKKVWHQGSFGSMVGSPLLTGTGPEDAVIFNGYDGIVRAFRQSDGKKLWKFGTRDHIYASPAQLSDGTIIQPSADGTVYALDPSSGETIWAFDTKEPIRSSPAVDGLDRIYFGTGQGKLFCLNPDGTRRWSYQCILDVRNDLNGSPALGNEAVYIAGESGEIFGIPYDYPLTDAGRNDPRVSAGPEEDLPAEGVFLFYTDHFGGLHLESPTSVEANQPLVFSLFVRENNDNRLAFIDTGRFDVEVTPTVDYRVQISADKRFLSLIPRTLWNADSNGRVAINFDGEYRVDPGRIGLKFFRGKRGGSISSSFSFNLEERAPMQGGESAASSYIIPDDTAVKGSQFEISRLAAPLPTILPSYNQIGWDSIHYLLGTVQLSGNPGSAESRFILWGIEGKLDGETGETVIDAAKDTRFVLAMDYFGDYANLKTEKGFTLSFAGWDMPYTLFRLAVKTDPNSGNILNKPPLSVIVDCEEIPFYGPFLKMMGIADFKSGLMHASAAADFEYHGEKALNAGVIASAGDIYWETDKKSVTAFLPNSKLSSAEHVLGILLIEIESGEPFWLNYSKQTTVFLDGKGFYSSISIDLDKEKPKGEYYAYLMLDTLPLIRENIQF
jgi:outer membrane protein assembly factor BamB